VDMNYVADEVLEFLKEKHTKVYRNRSPQNVESPYVVFRLESVINTYPSEDLYLHIDVYDKSERSVRAIEDLADTIDNDLNLKVINDDKLNLFFDREQRQYIPAEELVGTQAINLRYVVRAYFK